MASEEAKPTRQLEHLDGSRCLAAFWIVCAHYLPKDPKPILNGAVFRVNVAICYFVVASGFVTHWAYGSRDLSTLRGVGNYYLRRLGRIILTSWLAMAFACCVTLLRDRDTGTSLDVWYLVRCFLFVEQWVHWCPNGPSWFVFALLPAWILYPLTRHLVGTVAGWRGSLGLCQLLLLLWLASFGPAVVLFLWQGGNITMQQHHDMSFWPPAQLADFAIGVCTSALAHQRTHLTSDLGPHGSWCHERWLAVAPDSSLLAVILVVFLLPRPQETWALHLNGWEPMLDHGLAPLFAIFLYSAAHTVSRPSAAARLLSHQSLVALGTCSFEVYIFQRPVHDLFLLLFRANPHSLEAFLAYLLCLWSFAVLYARFVQDPMDAWLRALTAGWHAPSEYTAVDTPLAELPGTSMEWEGGGENSPL